MMKIIIFRSILVGVISLCASFGKAGAQITNNSFSLNQKSGVEVANFFSDYISIPFAEVELQHLVGQVDRLDSVDAVAKVVAGYTIYEAEDFSRVLTPSADNSNYFIVGFLPRDDGSIVFDFFVKVGYESYTESENVALSIAVKTSIVQYYNANTNRYAAIPDAIGAGIEVYLGYTNGVLEDMPFVKDDSPPSSVKEPDESLTKSSLSADIGRRHDVEVNPYVFVEEERTFMSISGVPLILPAGAHVRFYQLGHPYQSCVNSFTLADDDGIIRTYLPLQFVPGHNYSGYFSGYGYLPVKEHSQDVQKPYVKYNYGNFVKDPIEENYPSYTEGRSIGVTYGVVYPCKENRISSKYYTKSRAFLVDKVDLSDPTASENQDLSLNTSKQYLAINERRLAADIWANNSISVNNWDPHLEQVVSVNQTADKAARYPCIVDSLMEIRNVNLALDFGYSYATKLFDGSVAIIMTSGGKQYFAYQPFTDSDEVRYMFYHPTAGWVDIDVFADNSSRAIFQIFQGIGTLLTTGAFVYLSVAAGVAGGASGIAIVGKNSAYATIASAIGAGIFDVGFAFAEAEFIFYINQDDDEYWRTLKTGIVFAGLGTAGELVLQTGIRSFYAAKYGEELASVGRFLPNFNLVVKIKNGDEIVEVSLKQFVKDLKGVYQFTPQQVKSLLGDFKENGGFARAVLLDNDKVRAWEVLASSSDNAVRALRTDVNLLGRLSDDLVSSPGLKGFLDERGTHGFLAWKYSDEAFPNRPWCLD